MKVESFNRACRIIAAAWLILVTATTMWLRPTYQDFAPFYLGGILAREGRWAEIYPLMPEGNPYYIGDVVKVKPGFERLARETGSKDLCVYLQPPWTAIAFIPLSFLPFSAAHAVWIALITLCTIGLAWYAGRSFAMCAGGERSRWEGIGVLLVAFSLLAYRGIRVGNTSPLVAWCIAFATFDLMRRDGARSAVALWVGGVMKYATGVLVPVVIVMRRWRTLAMLALLGGITIATAWAMAGRATFAEFADPVASSIDRSSPNPGNQSIHAFLLRVTHAVQLSDRARLILHACQLIVLLAILALMFPRRREDWQRPPIVFAAVAALVCWLIVFAPLFWDHYHLYLAPFWGWMIWEARQSRLRAAMVVAAIAMAWAPVMVVRSIHIPEPANSAMLWSAILMLVLATQRLMAAAVHPVDPVNPE